MSHESTPRPRQRDRVSPLQRALADLLTALRRQAGLSQRQLARQINYSRGTIAGAETCHRVMSVDFWQTCDDALGSGGRLRNAFDQLNVARNQQLIDGTGPGRPPASGQQPHAPAGNPMLRYRRDIYGVQPSPDNLLVVAAADESSEHVARAEASNVGPATLDQLDADVRRLARDYLRAAPLPMFVEMVRLRDRVYQLLDGQQKPADTAHLYLLAGALCGLLANASTDLGHRDAAATQARAAWGYGEIAGHNGLRAWTRGMQALIEYWAERPQAALKLVVDGHRYADSTTATVRLLSIEARVWAQLGNADASGRCTQRVAAAREATAADLVHDDIGGVFAFDEPKAHYYAGATHIHLGQAQPALDATSRAIELYAADPSQPRVFGPESLARVDAATAHMINGDLDGAADVLAPVLDLPPQLRIAQLGDRLSEFRRRLTPHSHRRPARTLAEHVDDFVTSCGTPALPAEAGPA